MKKGIVLLATVLFGLGLQEATAQTMSLICYPITGEIEYTELDYSKLTFEKNEELYSVTVPFSVITTAPEGELFWLALHYVPKDAQFKSWGIFNAKNEFICRGFNAYEIGNDKYILQSQSMLTEQVTQGKYTLRLNFKEIPTNDVRISIGYSTREKYNEYAKSLSQKELNSILPPNSTAEQWSEKAKKCSEERKFGQAIKCYLQANKLQPDDFETIYNLGVNCFYLDNYELAVKYCQEALSLTDDEEDIDTIYAFLGASYFEMEDYEKADEYLSEVSDMTSYLYYILGVSKYNLGQYEEAMLVLKNIEEGDELSANAAYYRALSLWERGEELSPEGDFGGNFTKGAAKMFIERAARLGSKEAKEWLEATD